MMFTPVGALPGLELASGGTVDRRSQFAVRLASWKFDGATDRNTNFGASWLSPMGSKALFGATLGWMEPGGGGDGVLTAVGIDLKGSLGFAHFTASGGGADANAWSLVGQAPIKIRHTLQSKAMVSGFVSLGFGVGGLSDDVNSETGTRPMFSLGGAWTSAGGVGIHLGGSQVIIDGDPPWVWALSGSFPIGAKK